MAFDYLGDRARAGERLALHTTYRLGGECRYFLTVRAGELSRVWSDCAEAGLAVAVLGLGSNVLVADSGFEGAVLRLVDEGIAVVGRRLTVSAGASLAAAANAAMQAGLSGLEWAVGIPSTVGGAVVMNAGAFGGCVAERLVSCHTLDIDGEKCYINSDCGFGYRTSRFGKGGEVVIGAQFELAHSSRQDIERVRREYVERRRVSQPGGRSCGSVFANPVGDYAARLIDSAGCKGMRQGGAEVSALHANFIVAHSDATASDVLTLIERVRARVYAASGVRLVEEVKYLGNFV